MSKKRSSDFTLSTIDDLFTTQEERDEQKLERVKELKLNELKPFKDHPFRVESNEEMEKIIDSIEKFGVLTPCLARPNDEGSYELISGHRRLAACEVLGIETIPVIVRDLDDDEAIIAMVDANLQRETILPSEKAFAYKMKRDAISHQGNRTSPQLGEKLLTVERLGKDTGDSKNQVLRYIRLTYLHPDLLMMVDEGKIAFNPAVEISFLQMEEQKILLDAIRENDSTPSLSQAIRLKKMSQDKVLTEDTIRFIMTEEKPNQKGQIKIKTEEIKDFFPASYTENQMKQDIIKGLELLKKQRQRERSRDAR